MVRTVLGLTLVTVPAGGQKAALPEGVAERNAVVDGVSLNYKVAGRGPVVVLLHGDTQTSHMWLPLMPLLAASQQAG